MKTTRFLPVLMAGAFACAAGAQEGAQKTWIEVTGTSKLQYYGKSQSGHLLNVGGKKNSAYAYLYQMEDKKKKTFTYGKVFVNLDACTKGYGYLYYNDLDGNFVSKTNFVRFGETVADALGSMACMSWDNDTGKTSKENVKDAWQVVAKASDSGSTFSFKSDTSRRFKYNGKPAIGALFGYSNAKDNTVEYSEYVMLASDCESGYGSILELDFSGKQVAKSNVVLGGNSMIAGVASALCDKP